MSVPDHLLNPDECFCQGRHPHPEECGCEHCHFDHEHEWTMWAIYPPCEFCEQEMLEHWSEEIGVAA